MSLAPYCVHCNGRIAAGEPSCCYGHVDVRGVVHDLVAHARCFSFVESSALAMQNLVLSRAHGR